GQVSNLPIQTGKLETGRHGPTVASPGTCEGIEEERRMQSETSPAPSSKAMTWTGYVLSGLPVLFLLVDGVMKLFKPDVVVEATVKLGYPESVILGLGITLVACLALYLIPQTAVLGAILLTGYLGGAVATHVRHYEGVFPVAFPVIVGALLWGGLYLRDAGLRALVPWRS